MATAKGHKFVRVALVLPTEYAYARGVLRGILAATRERNMYASGLRRGDAIARTSMTNPNGGGGGGGGAATLPWLFNVFRGIHGHSSRFLAKWFRDWNPDGIICQIYNDRLAKVYRDTKRPVVELFERRTSSEFANILPDDVATGVMAARHFLERGFRHFGFFGASWMVWSRERERGFRGEVEAAFGSAEKPAAINKGRPTPRSCTFSSYGSAGDATGAAFGASEKKRAAAMAAWLASLPKPVAVFAANDLWGSELVQAAREANLRVPDDVAVLGVDNDELLCEITHPPLSSIRIGADQMGRTAVTLLEQMLARKPIDPQPARIPPAEVVARQSTDVLAVEDPDVAAALRHIRLHAVEGLSVKEMLEAMAVNRRTLERRFVSVLGHTPLEEIRRVRLERAKTLLQTDLPVHEVAARSGFATPEYLATSFLQATGLTPTAYRRQFGPRSNWAKLPPEIGD